MNTFFRYSAFGKHSDGNSVTTANRWETKSTDFRIKKAIIPFLRNRATRRQSWERRNLYKGKFLWLHAQNNAAVGIYLRLRYFDTHLQTRWLPGSAIFYQMKFHRQFSVYTGILWNVCRHEGREIPHLMLTKWFSLCRAKCRRCAHERRLWSLAFCFRRKHKFCISRHWLLFHEARV